MPVAAPPRDEDEATQRGSQADASQTRLTRKAFVMPQDPFLSGLSLLTSVSWHLVECRGFEAACKADRDGMSCSVMDSSGSAMVGRW